MSILKPLIVILGPTASGKSELALKLAKKYNGEIVNADSRQIYEEMYIGTGSPMETKSEKRKAKNSTTQKGSTVPKPREQWSQQIISGIPHHLYHFVKPNQKYSVAEYKKQAVKTIRDIHKRNKLPILAGGTGLYVSSVVDNLEIPKAAPSGKIRNKLEKHTAEYLFSKLRKIDPKSANIIGENNKRKLIRALEVFELTGKPLSIQQTKSKPLFDVLQIGIKTDREKLYKKIDRRVDEMIKEGLIEETKCLAKKYSNELPAMTGIGYKEIGQYLSGEINLEEATQRIKFRTHQYARRQMTWFRKDKRIKWVKSYKEVKRTINDFLKK